MNQNRLFNTENRLRVDRGEVGMEMGDKGEGDSEDIDGDGHKSHVQWMNYYTPHLTLIEHFGTEM